MGWTEARVAKTSVLFEDDAKLRFYFVHSYKVEVDDPETMLLESEYGQVFCSGLQKDNIIGVQFHPEKSHKYGTQFFRNFVSQL